MWRLRLTNSLRQEKHLDTPFDPCFLFLAEGFSPVFEPFVLGPPVGVNAVLAKGSLTVSLILLDNDGSIFLILT